MATAIAAGAALLVLTVSVLGIPLVPLAILAWCAAALFGVGAASNTASVGVTVWGWGNDITWPTDNIQAGDEQNPLFTRWVSYGYPAGANFKPLNSAVLLAR